MRQRDHVVPRSRSRALRVGVLSVIAALTLTGCEHGQFVNGFLPQGVTEGADRVTTLWVWSWIALFGVGFLVWGLIIWCMVAYRRRKDDNELPVQLRYNVPIEILYTVVPIFMIATFFYYTAKDEAHLLDTSVEPDVSINVVGKQWSWDFNYVDEQVHETGAQAILTGEPGAEETIPTLYLPVGERVQFYLTARDVIHSFWVPQFLFKMDVIPGRENQFELTPNKVGVFAGKCAELCGTDHSRMLFNVHVVTREEYEKHIAELKANGQSGKLETGRIVTTGNAGGRT